MLARPIFRTTLLLLTPLCVCGCGGNVARVSGAVTDASGAPVPGVRVVARQDDSSTWASGKTSDDGAFVLMTEKLGEGVPPGDYVIVLTEEGGDWDRSGPRKVPRKYGSATTSGFTFKATPGEEIVLDLKLDAS